MYHIQMFLFDSYQVGWTGMGLSEDISWSKSSGITMEHTDKTMVNDGFIVVCLYIKMDEYQTNLRIELDEGSMYSTGNHTCFRNEQM